MSDDTPISWARHTFNLWWGCDEPGAAPGTDFTADADRAPECLNCYARAWDHRLGGDHWGPGPRKFASEAYWAKPIKWNAAAERSGERASVFCQSMGDWAELHPDPEINARMDASRARLWQLVRATPWLDWLMLTKRVVRLPELLPWMAARSHALAEIDESGSSFQAVDRTRWRSICRCGKAFPWRDGRVLAKADHDMHAAAEAAPWPNVWLGTSCGARSSLWRVERLRQVPAALRFVSAEPLTERITAEEWDRVLHTRPMPLGDRDCSSGRIHWLIVGDESHQDPKKRRPAQVDSVRTARDAAIRHGVRFHFKQWNGPSSEAIHGQRKEWSTQQGKIYQGKIHLPVLDGRVWDQVPKR